ncbi:MAG TPA: glycosyltransferase, partial [Thermoanaerobaculia bacterium]|nr:glycosyltransferase [Thermoanaerobaculia bacterium]
MRVLQIVNRAQRRGAEVFALELSRELERTGHATRVVALYAGGDLPLRPGDASLGGRAEHPLERLPGIHPGLLRRLARAVEAFRPDVVQVNGSRTVKYGSLLRRLRAGSGWALVYRSIGTPGDWLRGRLHAGLYRRLVISGVDGIVAVSAATRGDLEARYAPRAPVAVIPRGVDVERFVAAEERAVLRTRLGTPESAPVLIALGSLSREKRPDRLLR